MSEAENRTGDAHVKRYRETGGDVGHIWKRGVEDPASDDEGPQDRRAAHVLR